MRKLTTVLTCVALAACSPRTEDREAASSAPITTADVAAPAPVVAPSTAFSAAGRAAPGIAVTAAPGVAFAYRYAFRLPSEAIAAVQERHAQACEKLGVHRCRITGMRYRLLGENNIEAMLSFKLDPAIARGFGKDSIAAVDAAHGKLVDAEITGIDAGAQIGRLDVQRGRTEDQVKRIDAQLATPKLKSHERQELQRQRAELVQLGNTARDETAAQQESLATTPMTFEYGSGAAVRGFDPSAPLTSAADTAIASAQITLAVLLGALAIFGPPALVVAAAFLLWRRLRPRRRLAKGDADARG